MTMRINEPKCFDVKYITIKIRQLDDPSITASWMLTDKPQNKSQIKMKAD